MIGTDCKSAPACALLALIYLPIASAFSISKISYINGNKEALK